MRSTFLATTAALLLAFMAPAKADVITTYTLDNVRTLDGGTATGSFQIDQTIWNNTTDAGFVGGSVTVTNDGSFNGVYSFDEFDSSVTFFDVSTATSFNTLNLPTGGPPPTENGSISVSGAYLTADAFDDSFNINDFFTQGNLVADTPIAAPEPESIAVFLVAFLTLGLIVRRRKSFG